MAIYRLLKETTFDANVCKAMGQAYESILVDLGLSDRNDPFTEIIAKEIIHIASLGVLDASEIRARVLGVFAKAFDRSAQLCCKVREARFAKLKLNPMQALSAAGAWFHRPFCCRSDVWFSPERLACPISLQSAGPVLQ